VRRLLPFILVPVLLSACGNDEVSLSYPLEPGPPLRYGLELEAEIVRTLAGETSEETVVATFIASHQVVETFPEGGARALMSLEPTTLVVDGEEASVGPRREFVVRLGIDGRVLEIESGAGETAEPLAQVGIERLLPRLRPVLPGGPAGLGDTWSSSAEYRDDAGSFSLELRSRLVALGLTDGIRGALVRTTYVSPVDRVERFANASADVDGEDVGVQESWFALDGYLVRSVGDSVGRYRVTFRPPGGEAGLGAVEGTLEVRLHTEMRLIGYSTPSA
jgi:hypothetical protein